MDSGSINLGSNPSPAALRRYRFSEPSVLRRYRFSEPSVLRRYRSSEPSARYKNKSGEDADTKRNEVEAIQYKIERHFFESLRAPQSLERPEQRT